MKSATLWVKDGYADYTDEADLHGRVGKRKIAFTPSLSFQDLGSQVDRMKHPVSRKFHLLLSPFRIFLFLRDLSLFDGRLLIY